MRPIGTIFSSHDVPFLIAEVGLGHDGSLGTAHAFIDAVATTGVDAIKFQTHIAAAESTPDEPFRVRFSPADATRYAYWERTGFSESQWADLKRHAEERGLTFLSSPFSLEAVELLERLDIAAWKVASGELGSRRMLERMAATGKPLLLSSGMSGFDELERLTTWLRPLCPDRLAVLQCTTSYPTPAAAVGLNVVDQYARRLGCPVGLSDHSGTPWPAVIAAWLGARVIEVHVTFSRHMFGPDVSSSLTIEDLARLVEGVTFAHAMRTSPIDKDAAAADKAPLRRMFGKSAVARRNLAAGEAVGDDDVAFLKPGGGLTEQEFDALAGHPLLRSVPAGNLIHIEDFQS